jgi:hypothetical protein
MVLLWEYKNGGKATLMKERYLLPKWPHHFCIVKKKVVMLNKQNIMKTIDNASWAEYLQNLT